MLKPYQITAWLPNADDPTSGAFGDIDVLIDENEIQRLHNPEPPEFLLAYVDDMDEWWIPVRNINQISEVQDD